MDLGGHWSLAGEECGTEEQHLSRKPCRLSWGIYCSQVPLTDFHHRPRPKDSALHHPIESVLTLKPRTHVLAEALPHFQSYFQLLTHLPAMQARTWITQTLEVAILNTATCLSCLLNFASVHLTCFDSVGLWVLFYQQGDYVVN